MKKTYSFLLILLILLSFGSCNKPTNKVKAIDPANMDTTVKPSADFDQYVNGGWKKNNPIPADKSSFGAFDILIDKSREQVKTLIDEITTTKHESGSVGQKIADFYHSGMDTVKIEADGASSLKGFFDQINAIKSVEELQGMIAQLHTYSISPIFDIGWFADMKNSEMVITYLFQGGLGLPDRDYYTMDDPRSKEMQAKYKDHLQKMFVLLGDDDATAKTNTEKIYSIEYRLATVSMTNVEQRDMARLYNKKSILELSVLSPAYNWTNYFKAIGVGDPGSVVVGQPLFFAEISKMMNEVSLDDWKVYLRWNVINSMATTLNKAFDKQNFDFYGKTLTGAEKQRARWKRVLDVTSNSMSEALGQLYVEKYFPPQAKQRMVELVNNLKTALGDRIKNLEWMSEETKLKGLEKLATVNAKIGYPDKWRDYSSLIIKNDSYALNSLRVKQFAFNFQAQKMNKPVDKSEWGMPPQMVNAYYNPMSNEIAFPAAILQPPFFYMDADDAVNYGAIGVVIGHEMIHGFDDQGRMFDKDGNMKDWWTEEDNKRFAERADVLIKQVDQYTVIDSIKANGKLTIGENLGDLAGISVSMTAFKKVLKGDEPSIDGFTPIQRFFLSYGQIWAENIRDEELIRMTKNDVHPWAHLRIIGPLRNNPDFHQAFDVKEGDFMYLSDSERAKIW